MELTFLGTGTSQGVPVIACNCKVCQSTDSYDKRLRSSVFIKTKNTNILIDSGPDFRYQMLRKKVKKLDGILITHEHKDHIAGLDDVRAFNFISKKPTEIYAEQRVLDTIKHDFAYAFADFKYPGIPKFNLNKIYENDFFINNVKITPIRVMHLKLPILGYRIGDITYITDANYIDKKNIEKIKGTKIFILNALRKEKHISHFCLDEAIEIAKKINAKETYFTHISHLMGLHSIESKKLPKNMYFAFDNLTIKI